MLYLILLIKTIKNITKGEEMKSLIPSLLSAMLILCLLMPQTVLADNATFDMVERVAQTHLKAQIEFQKLHSEKSHGIQDNEYHIVKIEHVLNSETGEILFYVAHLEPAGFIVISSDTDIRPCDILFVRKQIYHGKFTG